MQVTPEVTAARSVRDWANAFNAGNVSQLCALYDPAAILWGTMAPAIATSAQEVRGYFERTFQAAPDISVVLQQTHDRSFGETAVSTGAYVFTLSIADTTKVLPARFSFTYRRCAGQWLIVDHHSSLLPSPLAAAS